MVPCPCRTHTVQGPGTGDTKVEQSVSEHFSAQIQTTGVQLKLEPLLLVHLVH
jgi:hypothetical protein